jgi:hypothetical protein
MTELKVLNKEQLLQELKERVINKEISQKEVLSALGKIEMITEYEKPNLDNLTAENWKKACQILSKSKTYQEEVKL